MTLELAAGDWQAGLLPHLGGAVGSLRFKGADILRPAPAGTDDVLQTGCFPLLPYANRIADGQFVWNDRPVQLPVLPAFAPHAIHGLGWSLPWTVAHTTGSAAMLVLEAGGDAGWPWRFLAEQHVTLTDDGLHVALHLTNHDDKPGPAGLGLHPYFPLAPSGQLRLNARKVWLSDETMIPSRLAEPAAMCEFAQGARLPARKLIDHCYEGWDGVAALTKAERTVTVKADTGLVHIYAPPAGRICCVEPVTHRPDALNARPDESGMPVIEPGAQTSLRMEISAVNTTASQPAQ